MKYGYARVSTAGQDLKIQIKALEKEGCDKIYSEHFTGTKSDRPQFNELLKKLKEDDTLVVTKLDRFARSTRDAIDIVKQLFEKGVKVHVLNMGLIEDTPTGNLIFTVMMAFAQFERDMIVERTQEGKAIAKQKEGYREGRPKRYTKKQLDHALSMLDTHSYNQVAELTGISKSTLIREVKKRKESNRSIQVDEGVKDLKEVSLIKVTDATGKLSSKSVVNDDSSDKLIISEKNTVPKLKQDYELQEHHYDRFCNDCGESVAEDAEECGYCGGTSFDIMDLNDL